MKTNTQETNLGRYIEDEHSRDQFRTYIEDEHSRDQFRTYIEDEKSRDQFRTYIEDEHSRDQFMDVHWRRTHIKDALNMRQERLNLSTWAFIDAVLRL